MNSQLSKEITFKSVFRNVEHVLFCKISPNKISLMECSDWSVGQCLQTSNKASTASSVGVVDVGFRKLFPVCKVLTFERTFSKLISKLIFNLKGALH